jgi:hypothetical protein
MPRKRGRVVGWAATPPEGMTVCRTIKCYRWTEVDQPLCGPCRWRNRVAGRWVMGPVVTPCLTCDRPFLSEGPGNRLCGRCAHQPDLILPSSATRTAQYGQGRQERYL